MPSLSNIYAEKAYSEHPISLWALDDQLDYVTYLDSETRNVADSWTIEADPDLSDDLNVETSSLNLGQSLSGGLYELVATKRTGNNPLLGKSTVTSPTVLNLQNLDPTLATFSFGTYVYADTEYVKSITLGFAYNEEITQTLVKVSKTFETTIFKNWIYIAETFDIPNYTSDISLFIDFEYYDSEDPETEYRFYLNGLSLGQWSEEFQSESLGLFYKEDGTGSIIDFPSNIAVDGADKAVIARAYGLKDDNGYYLATANKLFSRNSGMPLVFGANSATRLIFNDGLPSLIIPAKGMLNSIGKNSTYTLEAWMRIDSISTEPHRIFGPVASDDGVYVDHERFYLKISDVVETATVSEWGGPTLVHLKYSKDRASLVVNAEELISIPIVSKNTSFPNEFNISGKSQDWIAFYSSDDVTVDLDCVGIYPYDIDKNMAKRKWIYGQNVEYPENLNSAYDGKTVAIDYKSANYAGNFNFPKNAKWSSGILDNVSIINNSLSSPEYPLPEIVLENGSQDLWVSDQSLNNYEGDPYLKMKPGEDWDDVESYLYLNNLSFLKGGTEAVYGIFKTTGQYSEDQILIKLRDTATGQYLSIITNGVDVFYNFYNGSTETTLTTVGVSTIGEMFVAGINLKKFSAYYGQEITRFVSSISNFEMFIGGDATFSKTYLGNIYKIALAAPRNSKAISYMFNDNGVALNKESFTEIVYDAGASYFGNDSKYWTEILDGGDPYAVISDKFFSHVASYTLLPAVFFNKIVLDIATSSSWEDYVPLSHFAKYVKDSESGQYYDLDFIQFNIGYPTPGKFVEQKSQSDDWTYAELQAEYLSPVQYTYAELDNQLFSGYDTYFDLQHRTKSQFVYDTSEYSVKTYITFQYISSGANNFIENYPNTESVSTNNLVRAGDEWVNTKYEVVDGAIIYPPKSIKFSNLAIVTHVQMIAKSSINKPSRVYNIELASQALDVKTPTPIGTKFGIPMYPYTKSGIYFNYKDVNPFKIYKKSTPYLYLTKNSGVELVGDQEPLTNRGLTIPLNAKVASKFDVSAIQVLLKYSQDFFPYSSTPIFEIQTRDAYIKFYLVANHPDGKRAKIYAINANTGAEENGIAFYINGKLVKNPNISVKEWSMLGIYFASKLTLNSYSGAFRLNGPLMVNHVSYYQSTGLQEKISTTFRAWDRVKETLTNQDLAWNFWRGTGTIVGSYSWNNVLVIGNPSILGISLTQIFKSYVGTNKTVFDDNLGVSLFGYKFRTYKKITPVTFTKKPS